MSDQYNNGILYYSVDPAKLSHKGRSLNAWQDLFEAGVLNDAGSGSDLGPITSNLTSFSRGALGRNDAGYGRADSRRNLFADCGFPEQISPAMYERLYERSAIAARVVELMPKESWQTTPTVFEDSDPENVTEFEEAVDNLGKSLSPIRSFYQDEKGSAIWDYLLRADIQAGKGQYGVILLGLDDGVDLSLPVMGFEEWNSQPINAPSTTDQGDEGEGDDTTGEIYPNPDKVSSLQRIKEESMRAVGGSGAGYSAGGGGRPGAPLSPSIDPDQQVPAKSKSKLKKVKPTTNSANPNAVELVLNYQKDHTTPDSVYKLTVNKALTQPKTPEGKASRRRLLYLRVFSEYSASITQFENNPRSPRFGQPTQYLLTFNNTGSGGLTQGGALGTGLPIQSIQVHWTRVIHVVDHKAESEVFHIPRMRAVFNNLLNLEKIYAGAAEGYWQTCIPLTIFFTNPQLGGNVTVNESRFKQMMENIRNGTQKEAILKGMQAMNLAPATPDPTPHIDAQKKAIANYLGCPMRVFDGSERGELASSQDDGAWNDELRRVQLAHNTPHLIVPLYDRLILCGVLPEPKPHKTALGGSGTSSASPTPSDSEPDSTDAPSDQPERVDAAKRPTVNRVYTRNKIVTVLVYNADTGAVEPKQRTETSTVVETDVGYSIEWPDLESQTASEKATVISTLTTALSAYAGPGNAPMVMPPQHYFTKVWDLDEEEVAQMIEDGQDHQDEQHQQQLSQQQDQIDAGVVADPTQPQGSPTDQGDTKTDPEADPNANPFGAPKPVANEEQQVENCGGAGSGVPGPCPTVHAATHYVYQLLSGRHTPQTVDQLKSVLGRMRKDDVAAVVKASGATTPHGTKKGMIERLHTTVSVIQYAKSNSDVILGKHTPFDPPPTVGGVTANAFCSTGKGGGIDATCGHGNGASSSVHADKSHESKLNLVRTKGNTHEGVPMDHANQMTDRADIHKALTWQNNMTFVVGANGPNKGLPESTRPKLSDLERGALQKYSYKNDGPLNQHLRGNAETTQSGHVLHTGRDGVRTTTPYKKEFYDEMHHQMQSAFSKAEVLKTPVKVVRGMNLSDSDLKGFVAKMQAAKDGGLPHEMQGYTSTTKPSGVMTKLGLVPSDKQIAKPFRGNVSMEIHAVHGIDMKPHTQLPAEGEFLLPHGAKMQVKEVKQRPDGGWHITLHQHPPESK